MFLDFQSAVLISSKETGVTRLSPGRYGQWRQSLIFKREIFQFCVSSIFELNCIERVV